MDQKYLASEIRDSSRVNVDCVNCGEEFAVTNVGIHLDDFVVCPHCAESVCFSFETVWLSEQGDYAYAFYTYKVELPGARQ